ncbi:hypothetical protein O3G_MSEX008816 [Manduca sexta]|uniref:Uncharacterized protein n=1 Tax=Manduca sexta TaxID=7130 RepID=A0A922CPJ4_MANSE|nr:hypothetical protein O3G_MSEX008816 [Manduca sexta]
MFPVAFVILWIVSSRIYLSVCTNCTDERQKMILKYDSVVLNGVSTLICESTEFHLKDKWPTVIILSGTQKVWKHKCYYDNRKEWDVTTFINTPEGAVGNVTTFVKGLSKKHSCIFYLHKNINMIEPQVQLEDGNYTKLNCSFKIHMKYNWKNLTLHINSEPMKIKPVFDLKEVDTKYVYEFVENELVNVQCNKPTQEHGRLHFVYSRNNFNYSSDIKSRDSVSFDVLLGIKQNYSHVDCVFSKQSDTITLRIYFLLINRKAIRVNGLAIRRQGDNLFYEYDQDLPSVCCVGFFIEGLSIKNLVLKTCDAKFCLIYYEYTDGDVLKLKGSSDNVICDRNDYLSSNGYYVLPMKFDDDMKSITCFIAGNTDHKTTVKFLVSEKTKEDQNPEITAGDDSNGSSEDSNNIATGSNSGYSPTKGENFFEDHLKLLVGIGLFLIILLLVLASVVCLLRKRRKPTTEGVQSDVDYVNLDHKNIEQFPKRLNTDVYLKPEESSDYSVPVDNSIDANLYSVPYKPKPNEELYAKPVPKNQRYVNGDEVKYAAIVFKKPECTYSNVNKKGNTECAYAQVQVRPEDMYAQAQPKGERNKGSHPTDLNSADYVEPSYCEVGALRK